MFYIQLDTHFKEEKQEKHFHSERQSLYERFEALAQSFENRSMQFSKCIDDEHACEFEVPRVEFTAKSIKHLAPILDSVNEIAQSFKQDFVIGIAGEPDEEICYFGFEEGKGDSVMIAQYLGL